MLGRGFRNGTQTHKKMKKKWNTNIKWSTQSRHNFFLPRANEESAGIGTDKKNSKIDNVEKFWIHVRVLKSGSNIFCHLMKDRWKENEKIEDDTKVVLVGDS